jgi:hypothetical protein
MILSLKSAGGHVGFSNSSIGLSTWCDQPSEGTRLIRERTLTVTQNHAPRFIHAKKEAH